MFEVCLLEFSHDGILVVWLQTGRVVLDEGLLMCGDHLGFLLLITLWNTAAQILQQ